MKLGKVEGVDAEFLGHRLHRPLARADAPGHERRPIAHLVELSAEVRDVEGRATHVQARDQSEDPNRLFRLLHRALVLPSAAGVGRFGRERAAEAAGLADLRDRSRSCRSATGPPENDCGRPRDKGRADRVTRKGLSANTWAKRFGAITSLGSEARRAAKPRPRATASRLRSRSPSTLKPFAGSDRRREDVLGGQAVRRLSRLLGTW